MLSGNTRKREINRRGSEDEEGRGGGVHMALCNHYTILVRASSSGSTKRKGKEGRVVVVGGRSYYDGDE